MGEESRQRLEMDDRLGRLSSPWRCLSSTYSGHSIRRMAPVDGCNSHVFVSGSISRTDPEERGYFEPTRG